MSTILVRLSLAANVIVLLLVCIALIAFGSSEPVIFTWGESTPARGILLSIYISILLVSCILLSFTFRRPISDSTKNMTAALLIVQVAYKLTTPLTVGISNPCVISNLCIAALHIATLILIRRDRSNPRD